MRLNTLAIPGIVVLALTATACKSSTHAAAPAPATNAPATQTQADDTTSASSSPSIAASPATSASASPAASSSATGSSAPAAPAAGGALNACSLLTGAQASSLTGRKYGGGTPATIANGQYQCTYPYSGPSVSLVVIVYAPTSGVSWSIMQSVLGGAGTVTQVAGVGDKAIFSSTELDIQTGKWLIAIQGADDLNKDTGAIAIGKQLVGALASK